MFKVTVLLNGKFFFTLELAAVTATQLQLPMNLGNNGWTVELSDLNDNLASFLKGL